MTKTIPPILKELRYRFDNKSLGVLNGFSCLNAASIDYLNYEKCKPILEKYGSCLNIDSELLKNEMARAKIVQMEGGFISSVVYPNLEKLKNLMLTLPNSSASVERSFSCYSRVMSKSRNKLSSSRANDFVVLAMNKDMLDHIDVDQIILRWSQMKVRVVDL